MSLYFTDTRYLEAALRYADELPENDLTPGAAFRILIQRAGYGLLDNLCARLAVTTGLSAKACCEALQTYPCKLPEGMAEEQVLRTAYACIDAGEPLGFEVTPGRFGYAGDWLSHCLIEGRLAAELAEIMGLKPEDAQVLGILHDCGRRVTQSFAHTIRGFELLCDAGHGFAALGCLTHSFLEGGRCTNCERAEPGFYVDTEGTPGWMPGAEQDDLSRFLAVYQYSDYDRILCFADLMATSRAVLAPADRVRDIMTRRVLDPVNHRFFLAEVTNSLNAFRCRMLRTPVDCTLLKADAATGEEALSTAFNAASAAFYDTYLQLRVAKKGETE